MSIAIFMVERAKKQFLRKRQTLRTQMITEGPGDFFGSVRERLLCLVWLSHAQIRRQFFAPWEQCVVLIFRYLGHGLKYVF
jgi:hypothetical protein